MQCNRNMWLLVEMDRRLVLSLNYFQADLSPFPGCMTDRADEYGAWARVHVLFILACSHWTVWLQPYSLLKNSNKKGLSQLFASALRHCVPLQDQQFCPLRNPPGNISSKTRCSPPPEWISWNKASLLVSKSICLFYGWWAFEQTIADKGSVESLYT